MTVAELIESLQAMPPDAQVWVHSYDDSHEANRVEFVLVASSVDSAPAGAVRIE